VWEIVLAVVLTVVFMTVKRNLVAPSRGLPYEVSGDDDVSS
jgi:hypothetical protein